MLPWMRSTAAVCVDSPKSYIRAATRTSRCHHPSQEVNWVEPLPDEWIDGQPDIYPEARYEVRESITLAFIAALQKLPGRQRAVLLLCDVMGWSANEAAEILDMTTGGGQQRLAARP